MKFNDFWESKWAYRLLALLLAIGLFAYVNVENINNTRQNPKTDNAITATAKRTMNVPLQLNVDSDKYFVTGYPEKVDVTIEGAASLVTVTANTQNFRVIADLDQLGVGKHTVKLTESGINKELTYKIKPATVTVNIQRRKTRRLPIQVKYNHDSLAPGYSVGTEKLNSETAEITGARSEVDRVYQVVANVVLKRNTKSDVSQEVILQALDEDGNTVNVVVSPETVHVTLPISIPSKQVSLKVTPTGTAPAGKTVSVSTKTNAVRIYGARSAVDAIDTLSVPVDISSVTKDQSQTLSLAKLFPNLTSVSPATISVDYKVTTETSGATSVSSTSSSSRASSDKSSSKSSSSASSASDASSNSNASSNND
ncbi:CdaR family protein [Lacticaseibacillus sp. GG6-2]